MANNVFLLGAARSGTKMLRDCLGEAEEIAVIPYDIGYIWRYGNESVSHDELLPEDTSPRIKSYINTSLDNLAKKSYGGTGFQTVLEKSVPNTLRPLFVYSLFPESKYIHIVRNGRSVIESAMRNWQNPVEPGLLYYLDKIRYFPVKSTPHAWWYIKNKFSREGKNSGKTWGPRYKGIDDDVNSLPLVDVCSIQWMRCVDTCSSQLIEIPDKQVLEIKYEDFITGTRCLDDVCKFANIEDVASVRSYYDKHVCASKQNADTKTISEAEHERINQIAGRVLSKYGY